MKDNLLLIYLAVIGIVSFITFLLYGIDKALAKHKKRRVSEKVLLALPTYGGAVGALFGRLIFRHKTQKGYFSAVIIISLLLQIGVLVLMIFQR